MTEPTRRSVARRLLRASGMYALAAVTPRALRLLLVPLLISAAGLETYGAFVLLSIVLLFAQVLCDLGMGTAAMRIAPHETAENRTRVFASLLAARLAAAGVVASVLIAAQAPLAKAMTGSRDRADGVVLVALNLLAFALNSAFADQLRSEERHATLAGTSVVRELCETSLAFWLVVVSKHGLEGMLVARLVADVAFLVLLATLCRRSLRARPTLSYVFVLARLGVPVAALYFLMCLRDIDRYLIKAVLGVSEAGRYDLALRIVAPVSFGNSALAMALEPHAYRTYAHPDAGHVMAAFLRVYAVLFGTVAFAAAMISPEVFPVLSPGAASGAAVIAPSLIFAFVGEGILRMAGIGADFAKRTEAWMLVVSAHLLVSLPATWLLLRPVGIFAAGAATFAGTLVAAEVAYALSRALYPLRLPVHRALALILVGAVAATLLVGGAGASASLAVRVLAVPFFALVALGITGLRPGEAIETLRGARNAIVLPGDAAPGGG